MAGSSAWNDGAERLLGRPAADALGQSLDLIVPAAYREAHWAAFQRAMHHGECRLDRAATNLPVLHADGTEHLLPARFVFLTDARDSPVGAMGIFADPAGGEQEWGEVLAGGARDRPAPGPPGVGAGRRPAAGVAAVRRRCGGSGCSCAGRCRH